MRRAVKLGRFAGIDVFLHWSFALLIVWVGVVSWRDTGTAAGVRDGVVVVLGLFFCVLLHEYGHALAARRYGIGTRRITLLPIGGVALLESMPPRPGQEIVVALAGPAVNLVIAALLTGWLAAGLPTGAGFAELMLRANVLLACFNLIPAFPMDGGRVLRAALWFWLSMTHATWIAAWVGRVIAVALAVYGVMNNPILVLIAVFIWFAGGAEARAVAARERRAAARRAEIDAARAAAVRDATEAGIADA